MTPVEAALLSSLALSAFGGSCVTPDAIQSAWKDTGMANLPVPHEGQYYIYTPEMSGWNIEFFFERGCLTRIDMDTRDDSPVKVTDEMVEAFCEKLAEHRHRTEPDHYPPTWAEFQIKHPDRVANFRADARFGLEVMIPFLKGVVK